MNVRWIAAMAALIVTVACSAPPDKERLQAEGAISAARDSGAAVYAPADLKSAEDALEKYEAAVAQRDYRQALSLAVEARDTAYQAAKHSSDQKAAAKTQAEHLLSEAAQLIQSARPHLHAGTASAKLRAGVTAADPALQDARASFAHEDYRGVVASLTPIVEDLRAEMESVAPHRSR